MRSHAIGIAITVGLLTAGSAFASLPCRSEYDDTRHALFTAKIGQGSRQKVWTKVANAWRQYERAKNQWEKNSQQQLDQAQQLLSANSTKHIPAATRMKLQGHVTTLSQCLAGTPTVVLAPLQIHVFFVDDEAGTKTAAGAGAIVSIDGIEEGTTGADGSLTVKVAEGQHAIAVQQYGSRSGNAVAEAVASVTTPVEVLLQSSAAVHRSVDLYVAEWDEGTIPATFSTLVAYFLDVDAKAVPIARLVDVRLQTASAVSESLLASFAVQTDGRIAATSLTALKTWLDDHYGPYILEVTALDAASSSYKAQIGFEIGRHRATARLQAPAGVAVPLGNLPLLFIHEKTNLVFSSVTDATGAVALPLLPDGFFFIEAETAHDGKVYLARGAVYFDGDRTLTIPLFQPGTGQSSAIQSAGGAR